MRQSYVNVISCVVVVLMATVAMAAPVKDSPKPADPPMPWTLKARFSRLYGGDGAPGRWPSSYGSYEDARRTLERGLRNAAGVYSTSEAYHILKDACSEAIRRCGGADAYRLMIQVLVESADKAAAYRDSVKAFKGGMDFLVNGSGSDYRTQDLLRLGLSETRQALGSYQTAYDILYCVLGYARKEAEREDGQWFAVLGFVKAGVDKTATWRNGYKVLERSCYIVADSRKNAPVYIKTLAAIADSGLDSEKDLYDVLVTGLKIYGEKAPSATHRALGKYLVACADKLSTWHSAVKVLRTAVGKMQDLDIDVSEKVLLRAGRDLSAVPGLSRQDACDIAVLSLRYLARMDVPRWIKDECDHIAMRADSAPTYREALRIVLDGIDYLLGRSE